MDIDHEIVAARSVRWWRVLAVGLAAAVAVTVAAAPAHAAFGVKAFDGQVTANAAGDAFTQAGGHPYSALTTIEYNSSPDPFGGPLIVPDDNVKGVLVDLPPGLVGNPVALPKCTADEFYSAQGYGGCSPNTQIGVARVTVSEYGVPLAPFALYNMEPAPGELAQFAFKVASTPIFLTARLRPEGDYGVSIDVKDAGQGLLYYTTQIELWGNPGDPVNDHQRCQLVGYDGAAGTCYGSPGDPLSGPNPARYPEVPVLSNPTACTPPGVGLVTSSRSDSWQQPGVYHAASFESHLPPGYPAPPQDWGAAQGPTGCDLVPFDPSAAVTADTRRAGSSSGLNVDLTFPQDGLTEGDGLATAHLREARVELPDGMTINPSSASGLQACSDEQMGFGTNAKVACPDGSVLGAAWASTPLLEERAEGRLYLATQQSDDPASGKMFRAFLALENKQRGLLIKLRGQVHVSEQTGKVVAVFDENPQLPVDRIHVSLKGGDRAPLVTPGCGSAKSRVELTSWAAGPVQVREPQFLVDQNCGQENGFDPSFTAGSENAVAGTFTPFRARIERQAGKELGRIDVRMPEGLVAQLKHVDLCTSGQIAAATGRGGRATQGSSACPAGSRIGSVTVGAGAGTPFYPALPGSDVSGRVFLTEGYKSAPYGLAIEVPAVAGPFDLGTVMVRAAVHVDPDTAKLSVLSDQLPAIVKGIPLNVRDVRVDIDRPRFTVNPTSCEAKSIGADIAAQDGTGAGRSAKFAVGDCARLPLSPKVAMTLAGRGKTKLGANPALRVRLRQPASQSNLETVKTTLPLSIALDARNTSNPKLLCGYDAALKANCPASSVIGQAKAVSPLLKRPLAGPVHLVQGIKFGPKGNRIRTTPTLLVKLAGEVKVNVRARTTATNGRLVTTFERVPDAAVSDFRLNLAGGEKNGILTVTRGGLCAKAQNAKLAIRGHNGKLARPTVRIKTPCGKASRAKTGRKNASHNRR